MPAIGHVTKQKDGNFKGQLKTLSFNAPVDILINTAKNGDKQPDYRVYSRTVEVGAGWTPRAHGWSERMTAWWHSGRAGRF